MPVKMRIAKGGSSLQCNACGDQVSEVLEMYELYIGSGTQGHITVICDKCMEQLQAKSLHAIAMVNGRTKSQHDMSIIRRRAQAAFEVRHAERVAAGRVLERRGK